MKLKICKICKTKKRISSFYVSYISKYTGLNIYRPECKKCNIEKSIQFGRDNKDKKHKSQIKYHYGISAEKYEELLKSQNGLCFLCKKIRPNNKRLHVDHCHKSGEVRKLLCYKCNSGLGLFEDNVEVFKNAIIYIEEFK